MLGLWLGLSGCSNLQLQQKQAPIVVASFGSIDTIDPAQATTTAAIQLLSSLGDPLYGISADGQIEPRLAIALPQISNQGLRAVIQLRKGVIFMAGPQLKPEERLFIWGGLKGMQKLIKWVEIASQR